MTPFLAVTVFLISVIFSPGIIFIEFSSFHEYCRTFREYFQNNSDARADLIKFSIHILPPPYSNLSSNFFNDEIKIFLYNINGDANVSDKKIFNVDDSRADFNFCVNRECRAEYH